MTHKTAKMKSRRKNSMRILNRPMRQIKIPQGPRRPTPKGRQYLSMAAKDIMRRRRPVARSRMMRVSNGP